MQRIERSRFLVDPPVQWAIARRVFCHWVLFLIILVSIGTCVRLMVSIGDQPLSQAWRSAARDQIPNLLVMLLLLPVFLRDTLQLSNRFAGPMYRLRTALRHLARQEPVGPIRFRKGDFWQDVPADFNAFLEDYQALKAENAELKAHLEASESAYADQPVTAGDR